MIRVAGVLFLLPLVTQEARPPWRDRLEKSSATAELWKERKEEIRRQILVAAGLWPEFERPPLAPRVYGRVEGEGYTVERVLLETLPGFHLSGSLYRPAGKAGPFPAVASPHGHWGEGRFTQTKDGNLPARGITFARLGFVCFMYDMVGYADFKQLPHRFQDPDWGMGLLGLQTWNSLRAVDFLVSLPDVDPKRIGATGASGGGTQTFLLTAVDERIRCAAPVNMVAAEFQGGCSCENAPFLRIDLNNVEIAAATAPRPLLLVSCTGDWTKNTLTLEGPAVEKVYQALGVPERLRTVQFNYPHNYNQDSREAVYAWFVRWLQNGPDQARIAEPPVGPVRKEDLTVWTGDVKPPADGVNDEKLKLLLREKVKAQLEALQPRDAAGLARFRSLLTPGLRHALCARWPEGPEAKPAGDLGDDGLERVSISHRDLPRAVELGQTPRPKAGKRRANVIVVGEAEHASIVQALVRTDDLTVVLHAHEPAAEPASGGNDAQRKSYPTCFYRTPLARRVQDVLLALAYVLSRPDVTEARLVGIGDSGPTALLARGLAPQKVTLAVADTAGLDDGESTWTGARAHPGMMRFGGLRTAASLAAPSRLVLHNMQGRFNPAPVLAAYAAAGAEGALTLSETGWDAGKVLEALR
jgi:hypothetical protein